MNDTPRSGRALHITLGLALVMMGLAGTLLLWRAYQRAEETRSWTPAPCLVIFSRVLTERHSPNSPPEHRASIRYRYTFQGTTHEGTHIHRVDGGSSDRAKIDARCAEYPVGRETMCFVNPKQPDFAVLEHDTRAALYSIWFPLLFIAGGAGMIYGAIRRRA